MSRKNGVNICALVGLLDIILIIIYLIVCICLKLHNQLAFRIVFACMVALYIIVTDFIEPNAMNRFKKKNKKQIGFYYKYAILDCLGVAGLLWFAIMAGIYTEPTHYAGIAIFVITFVPKNIFYKKYSQRLSYYERYEMDDQEDEDIKEEEFDIDISF